MPSMTLVTSREKEAKAFKQPKDKVTIMACLRCFKNIDKKDLPVQYFNQRNAWMDSSIFNNWFHNSFVPFCQKALSEKGRSQKAIFLLDNASSHPDNNDHTLEDGQITCLYMPPNTTSVLQPMDQGVLENIKKRYKKDLLLQLLYEGDSDCNIAEFRKTLNIKYAVLMTAKSWNEVEQQTIAKSWKKLWPIVNGPDEDQHEDSTELSDVSVETLLDRMDIPHEDHREWLATDSIEYGYRDPSDEEIIRIVREETDNTTEEEEQDNSLPKVSHAKACQALETIILYAEEQSDIPMSTSLILNGLLLQASEKRAGTLMQGSIQDYCK